MSINPSRTPARTGRPYRQVADTAAAIFANARSRALLSVLLDMPPDTPVELDALAAGVAAAETTGPPQEEHEERVLWSLFTDHLPFFETAGLVEVDRKDGVFVTPDRAALDSVA